MGRHKIVEGLKRAIRYASGDRAGARTTFFRTCETCEGRGVVTGCLTFERCPTCRGHGVTVSAIEG